MPMIESSTVKVTLTVEMDGHALSWEHASKLQGARYHGADPRKYGYSTAETFESRARAEVVKGIAAVEEDARRDVFRLYPVIDQ